MLQSKRILRSGHTDSTKKTEQFIEAHPVSGTRKRNDLPPIAAQWQQEFRKRNKNGKSSGRR